MIQSPLVKLSAKCASIGVVRGESAAQFRARNPQSAAALSAYIAKNSAALTKSIASCVS
jgi:hypothetical protein